MQFMEIFGIFIYCVLLALFFVPGIFLFVVMIRPYFWSKTNGIIIDTDVRNESDSEGNQYFPSPTYTYMVISQKFTNSQVRLLESSEESYEAAEKINQKLEQKKEVTVYYSRKNPQNAVIDRSIDIVSFGIMIVTLTIGIMMLRAFNSIDFSYP